MKSNTNACAEPIKRRDASTSLPQQTERIKPRVERFERVTLGPLNSYRMAASTN
jgi:hypothetical protein